MKWWGDNKSEFDEMPDEEIERSVEEELEIPDVRWAENIKKIKNPKLREKEIIAA